MLRFTPPFHLTLDSVCIFPQASFTKKIPETSTCHFIAVTYPSPCRRNETRNDENHKLYAPSSHSHHTKRVQIPVRHSNNETKYVSRKPYRPFSVGRI